MIYFIRDGHGAIKIGYTHDDPRRRVATIQVSCSSKVELIGVYPGGRAEELRLHSQFAAARIIGEWFVSTEELKQLIREKARPVAEFLDQLSGPRDRDLVYVEVGAVIVPMWKPWCLKVALNVDGSMWVDVERKLSAALKDTYKELGGVPVKCGTAYCYPLEFWNEALHIAKRWCFL